MSLEKFYSCFGSVEACTKQNVVTPQARKGSQVAISVFCDIANGTHPVEALLRANLDVQPRRRG